MTDAGLQKEQLIRYSRQIMLDDLGVQGQRRLLAAHVLIIGAGGLGSASAMSLAALGVGHITMADDDVVEASNLHRQLLHDPGDTGKAKVESAAETLGRLNPELHFTPVRKRVGPDELDALTRSADVVIDGCDNFDTRFAVNTACLRARRALVSGAAIRFQGQLAVFRADRDNSPCYRCLYPEASEAAETCAVAGVLPPVVGVIGNLQALEAVKIIAGLGENSSGRLQLFDALTGHWRNITLHRDPQCPACGSA